MSEDRALQARKAAAMIDGMGEILAEYRGRQMAVMLSGEPPFARDAAYVKARIVTEIEQELRTIVEGWEADQKLDKRRDQLRGTRNV